MFKSNKSDRVHDGFDEPLHDSFGKLLLRCTVGGLMLLHGIAKIQGGIDPIEAMVTGAGFPAALSYGVYVGEVVAPILLIFGLWTRIAAFVFAFNMVVAIGLAHRGDLVSIGPHGGWAVELAGFYLFASIAIALLGPGRISIGRKTGLFA